MLDKRNWKKIAIIITILFLAFLGQGKEAYAWGGEGWDHHGYRHHHDDSYGRVAVVLPHGFLTVVIGGGRYYYCDGYFYRQSANEYIVVPAPTGAVVSALPPGYHKVVVDGTLYYTHDGVYYRRISDGYLVVEPPAPVVVDTTTASANPPVHVNAPVTVASAAETSTEDSFTVNIPNSKGGYTPVVLKRSGNGFIGPQGEFYQDFPKVAQLKVMYAK